MTKWVGMTICWLCVGGHLLAGGMIPAGVPDSIGAYPLSLAVRYTTNLIFPYAIAQVDLGSGDIIAKKMGKMENVLLLKARVRFAPTNVSVYLENGKLYSFAVSFSDSLSVFNYSFCSDTVRGESPPVAGGELARVATGGRLEEARAQLSGRPVPKDSLEADARRVCRTGRWLKARKKAAELRLALRGVFLKDKVLWLGMEGRNQSPIDFKPGRLRFSICDSRRVRRTAVQTVDLQPVCCFEPTVLSGNSTQRWAAGFDPFTLVRGKRLVIEWTGAGDGRSIRLVVKGKHLLKAKIL